MQDSSFPPFQNLCDRLLVAAPRLQDPNFRESLVYLADHSDEGALGMILNRPIRRVLSDILGREELPELLYDVPLFFGGPVGNGQVLLALFTHEAGETHCQLNPDAEAILKASEDDQAWLRAFVGYSGWAEGQLEGELGREDWLVARPEQTLFDEKLGPELWPLYVTGDQRWRKLLDFLPKDGGRN